MNTVMKPVAIVVLTVVLTLLAALAVGWLEAQPQPSLGQGHAFFDGLIKKIGTVPKLRA
jgi:hypothetical protein